MNNLIDVLREVAKIKPQKPIQELLDNLTRQSFLKILWDEWSGENWISVMEGENRISIIHASLPLLFVHISYSEFFRKLFQEHHVIIISNFDNNNWYVELDKLKSYTDIRWSASIQAVDPSKFSINELWYATI